MVPHPIPVNTGHAHTRVSWKMGEMHVYPLYLTLSRGTLPPTNMREGNWKIKLLLEGPPVGCQVGGRDGIEKSEAGWLFPEATWPDAHGNIVRGADGMSHALLQGSGAQ